MLSKIINGKVRLKFLYFISLAQIIMLSYRAERDFPYSGFKANSLISSEFNINNIFMFNFIRLILLPYFISMSFNVLFKLMWKLFLPNSQITLDILKRELDYTDKLSKL